VLAALSVLAGALVVLAPTTGAVASGCPSVGSGAAVLDTNFAGCGIATAQPGTALAGYPGVVNAVTTESVNGSTDVVIAGQYQPRRARAAASRPQRPDGRLALQLIGKPRRSVAEQRYRSAALERDGAERRGRIVVDGPNVAAVGSETRRAMLCRLPSS